MAWIWDNINLGKALGLDITFPFKGENINTDSRKIEKGDIFVALKGVNFDGNKFAEEALKKGAIAAIVDDRALKNDKFIRVDDALKALQKIGKWRRKNSQAKFIALSGSVGKTGTKEMLYAALSTKYRTYRTQGNLNNHIGLPLTLCNMPDDIEYAVIELGMSNIGEISELVRICQPDIACITWVSEAHIENLGSEENIARAKAEIFEWVAIQGSAVIPADNDFYDLLNEIAEENHIANIYSFGIHANAVTEGKKETKIYVLDDEVSVPNSFFEDHVLNNVLLVLTVCAVCGVDLRSAIEAIAKTEGLKGRGKKTKLKNGATLIDDSYNASPTSMKLALQNLAKQKAKRKMAVLGDMKELGVFSRDYHEELANYIGGIDMVVTCGEEMKNLHKIMKKNDINCRHFDTTEKTKEFLESEIRTGDTVMIKGSHGSNMWKIAEKLVDS